MPEGCPRKMAKSLHGARSALSSPIQVELGSYKLVGWVCAVGFAAGGIAALFARQYFAAAGLFLFVALGIYIVLAAGSFSFSEQDIVHSTRFRRYLITWDQVRVIEVGNHGSLVLHGDGRRFALAPVSYWTGKEKEAAAELLSRKIETLGLKTYRTNTGDYKTHRNVQVS
jgi:hypothetical protein